jgi:hypothetical protein
MVWHGIRCRQGGEMQHTADTSTRGRTPQQSVTHKRPPSPPCSALLLHPPHPFRTSAVSNIRYPACSADATAACVPSPSPAVPNPNAGIRWPPGSARDLKGAGNRYSAQAPQERGQVAAM